MVLVDISTCSMIGQQEYRVIRPTARQLVTRNKASTQRQLDEVTKQSQAHKLVERQEAIAEELGKEAISMSRLPLWRKLIFRKRRYNKGQRDIAKS
jgi:hypothetical protein